MTLDELAKRPAEELSQQASIRARRIVDLAQAAGEFVTGDDGFVVYWPKNQCGGCYSAHDLRALADELDKCCLLYTSYAADE